MNAGSAFYSHGWPDSGAEYPTVSYSAWNVGYLPAFLQFRSTNSSARSLLEVTHVYTVTHISTVMKVINLNLIGMCDRSASIPSESKKYLYFMCIINPKKETS